MAGSLFKRRGSNQVGPPTRRFDFAHNAVSAFLIASKARGHTGARRAKRSRDACPDPFGCAGN